MFPIALDDLPWEAACFSVLSHRQLLVSDQEPVEGNRFWSGMPLRLWSLPSSKRQTLGLPHGLKPQRAIFEPTPDAYLGNLTATCLQTESSVTHRKQNVACRSYRYSFQARAGWFAPFSTIISDISPRTLLTFCFQLSPFLLATGLSGHVKSSI
jgi:hypothetical protein